MDKELRRELLLEHFDNPVNKVNEEVDGYLKYNSNNPNCIDNIDIFIKFNNNIIEDIKFMGEACCISTASTSIMIKNLLGLDIDEAIKYVDNFYNMVYEKEYDDSILNEGLCFDEIYKQNNRVNCAILPYKGIKKALEEYKN